MEFLDKRITVICNELKKLKVKKKYPIEHWEYKEGNYITPKEAASCKLKFEPFDCKHMHWYGKDRHYWFKTTYTIPEELHGKDMWLYVCTQIDEWDDGKNPQFLLFVNGKAIQGIDMNHREVLLTADTITDSKVLLELQAYTGTLHTEFHLVVEMREIDKMVEELYYDLWVPLAAFPRMEEDSRDRKEIEYVLNETINHLDLRTPYSVEFYKSLNDALAYIKQELYEKMAGYSDIIATCIGHTHIDVAWWWTVEQTREKVGRSFATVLKLMEEYPNYKFMSSQPQLYVFLKERYPELYEQVKQRVKEKRWEPEGGTWVEPDCNITSGESLVRQFMFGKRFFKEEFDVDNHILWLPDVFGYSGALPQIMKKCGIDYFMTTKLNWNQFNKIPNDTMWWRGIDGTEIFTHLVTTLSVNQPIKDYFTTYNGMLHPDSIMGGWLRYQNKDINNDILVSYGYGDGGGGPTREMLETSKRMEKGIKGIPRVRQEFSGVYFEELEERVKDDRRLPVWEGELYFEYHRGTYTSMGRNKRSNRKSGLGLMDAEFLSVLTRNQAEYPMDELSSIWRTVLLNQFHDILPGTSIHEVYEVTKKEYKEIEKKLQCIIAERLQLLTDKKEDITIVNTIGMNRNDVIELGEIEATHLEDVEGNQYPIQKTKEGAVVFVTNLPSKGYKTFIKCKHEKTVVSAFQKMENNQLITPYYLVSFDQQGNLIRLYDKEAEREVIQQSKKANLLRMYEDKPIYYDNWDVDIFYTEKHWDVEQVESIEWEEMGPVRATLAITKRISNSLIQQKIHFYANSRRIDFATCVDWREHQHLLKVHFPVDVHTDEATFDIQFGNLKRKVHQNTSWDRARFESCGQKWMDLSEGHYGVSLLNDCKYGHSVKDSNIALTLIKSGIEPNQTADQEEHFFTYALFPHIGGNEKVQTIKEAYCLNQPALIVDGKGKHQNYSFAQVNKENVILETIKLAESKNGIILRMYESENARTKVTLTVNTEFTKAYCCNLLEEEEMELLVKEQTIDFWIKPFEIYTIKIM